MGHVPDELANAPPLPPELAHVWRWFGELHATRQHGEFGAQPICYAEIEAWARLTGTGIQPFEVAALLAVDNSFLTANEKTKAPNGS